MKKLMFVAAICSAVFVNAECPKVDAACAKADKAIAAPVAAESAATMTKEQKKVDFAKRRAEWRAKRDAADKAAAEKKGQTLEEYRAERKAKRDAMMAKRLGVSPEEFAKMTPDERRAKMTEMMKKRAAERKQKAEKAVAPVAPAAK